jgi:hypothetical protein
MWIDFGGERFHPSHLVGKIIQIFHLHALLRGSIHLGSVDVTVTARGIKLHV